MEVGDFVAIQGAVILYVLPELCAVEVGTAGNRALWHGEIVSSLASFQGNNARVL